MYDAIQEELTDYYMAYPNIHNKTTDEPIWGQYAGYGDYKYRCLLGGNQRRTS